MQGYIGNIAVLVTVIVKQFERGRKLGAISEMEHENKLCPHGQTLTGIFIHASISEDPILLLICV